VRVTRRVLAVPLLQDGSPIITPSDTIVSKGIVNRITVLRMRLITYRGPRDVPTVLARFPIRNLVERVDTKHGRRWMENAVPI